MAARQRVGDSVGMAAIPSPEPPRADVDALTRAEARLRGVPEALLRRRSTVRREPGIYAPPGHAITAWDLVAAGDGLLNTHADGYDVGRPPLCTPEDLRRYLRAHRGARGIRAFERAVSRMRPGSDSPPETFLRLACEDHGIDGLVPGLAVRDARGLLAFQADLALPRLRLSIQYEGAHHDRPQQVRRDVERARRTAEAGWIEVRITAADLREAVWCAGSRMPRAVAIILRAIRDHDAAATPNDAESSISTENRRISGRK